MRSWVPVPGTTKGRLVEVALDEFGQRGYEAVAVNELAESAGVTIGALYHHFGSKLGLYTSVRGDVERRVLDRMEGARAVAPDDLGAALGVGFDYLVDAGFARMLAEQHPVPETDCIESFIATRTDSTGDPIGRLLAAAWRAALDASVDDPTPARNALIAIVGHVSVDPSPNAV